MVGRTNRSSSINLLLNSSSIQDSLHQSLTFDKITTWEDRNTIATILVLILCTKDSQAISTNTSAHSTSTCTTVASLPCITEFILMPCTPRCIITTTTTKVLRDLLLDKITTMGTLKMGSQMVILIEPGKCIRMVILNIISSTNNIHRMVTASLFTIRPLLHKEARVTDFSCPNTMQHALQLMQPLSPARQTRHIQ